MTDRKGYYHPFKSKKSAIQEAIELAILHCDAAMVDNHEEQERIMQQGHVFKRLRDTIILRGRI